MNILDLSYDELIRYLAKEEIEKYRADQILDWIYKKGVYHFNKMTNLPLTLRKTMSDLFTVETPQFVTKTVSSFDKTTKYLWKLNDANTIESVLLFHEGHTTGCISTQVGCPVGCSFCATGRSGYVRNLSSGEIVGQLLAMENISDHKIRNVVLMGMGEPLLNYNEVLKAIRSLIHPKMRNMGARRITVSTVGIPEKIRRLTDEGIDLKLAVSLHSSTNEKRDQIIPLNKAHPIQELIEALKYYQRKTKNRITIEYILIRKFNDYDYDAENLARLLKDLKVFVNLIPANPVGTNIQKPEKWKTRRFREILLERGIEAAVRYEKGVDIQAACGQLRARKGYRL